MARGRGGSIHSFACLASHARTHHITSRLLLNQGGGREKEQQHLRAAAIAFIDLIDLRQSPAILILPTAAPPHRRAAPSSSSARVALVLFLSTNIASSTSSTAHGPLSPSIELSVARTKPSDPRLSLRACETSQRRHAAPGAPDRAHHRSQQPRASACEGPQRCGFAVTERSSTTTTSHLVPPAHERDLLRTNSEHRRAHHL